ncbi:MAG: TlyA family RNA methyltransferase [Desulfovibrionales bacterium]
MGKKRADSLVYSKGLSNSREKAKRQIMAGQVYVCRDGGKLLVAKPGQMLDPDVDFYIKQPQRFVSRGGYKLETAIKSFDIDFTASIVLDVGASTGGFTDCALQYGADKIYALDVGYGQLDYRLRSDSRVINLERINIRHAPPEIIPEKVDFLVMDCSFISLRMALPPALKFLKSDGRIVVLVKPQFEVSRGNAPKGVVRCLETREAAVDNVVQFIGGELALAVKGRVASSILGPKGNQEYLLYCAYE